MSSITVLSSLATREAYLELVPQFEQSTGAKVTTTWAGTVDINKRMAAGEVFDLVISSNAAIGELTIQGKIVAGTGTVLAKAGIGIGVRKGAPKPDVGTPEAFKRALIAARTVGLSTGPSGVYLEKLFQRLGVADAVKAKTRLIPSGGTVSTLLAARPRSAFSRSARSRTPRASTMSGRCPRSCSSSRCSPRAFTPAHRIPTRRRHWSNSSPRPRVSR